MTERCDWRNPKKRNGEPGRRCGLWAEVKVIRDVDGHVWENYRCAAHVPTAEPRIGTLELVDVRPPAYLRSSSQFVADSSLRGF